MTIICDLVQFITLESKLEPRVNLSINRKRDPPWVRGCTKRTLKHPLLRDPVGFFSASRDKNKGLKVDGDSHVFMAWELNSIFVKSENSVEIEKNSTIFCSEDSFMSSFSANIGV